MINIKLDTYNDALRLSRCLELKKYISGLSDERIEECYNHLSKHPMNIVGVSGNQLYFRNSAGKKKKMYTCKNQIIRDFDHIIVSSTSFRVVNKQNTSSDYGCGGCGSNNNNNNNG